MIELLADIRRYLWLQQILAVHELQVQRCHERVGNQSLRGPSRNSSTSFTRTGIGIRIQIR